MAADAPEGAILEMPLAGSAIALELAHRIAKQGGAAIVIDYGYEGPATGDTLPADRAPRYDDPFLEPGERELTPDRKRVGKGNGGSRREDNGVGSGITKKT